MCRNARRDGHGAGSVRLLNPSGENFVEYAVIATGEHDDSGAASNAACHSNGGHDGFRSSVAERRPVHARHFAEHGRDLTRDGRLRADLKSAIELGTHGVYHEVGCMPEDRRAKAVHDVDILVPVQIPQARTPGMPGDDGIHKLFPLRAKSGSGTRIGEFRAVLLRQVLRLFRS